MASGAASASHGGISRTRDGVPGWNGEPSLFTEYEEECLIWVQSVLWHKRQLCGPKLIQELSGPARRLVLGQALDWTAHPQGVENLMKHLRSCLGKPLLLELSDFLLRYFRSTKRRAHESMGDYITKKCEVCSSSQMRPWRPHQERPLARKIAPNGDENMTRGDRFQAGFCCKTPGWKFMSAT